MMEMTCVTCGSIIQRQGSADLFFKRWLREQDWLWSFPNKARKQGWNCPGCVVLKSDRRIISDSQKRVMALMLSEIGWTQVSVAKEMGISKQRVHRMIVKLKQRGQWPGHERVRSKDAIPSQR